jgi:hypothetical protein
MHLPLPVYATLASPPNGLIRSDGAVASLTERFRPLSMIFSLRREHFFSLPIMAQTFTCSLVQTALRINLLGMKRRARELCKALVVENNLQKRFVDLDLMVILDVA